MVDFELQRKNMVESQVRPSDVTDRRILRAMRGVAREDFAAPDTRAIAYMDQDLPVGAAAANQTRRVLPAPRTFAQMVQHLELSERDRVMELGTATGYGAAVLAHLAKSVIGVDSDAALTAQASKILGGMGVANVRIITAALDAGAPDDAPYSAILMSGAVSQVPPALLDQLQDGGRLTVIMREAGVGRLMQWRRLGSTFDARAIMEASLPDLPGFERSPEFVF